MRYVAAAAPPPLILREAPCRVEAHAAAAVAAYILERRFGGRSRESSASGSLKAFQRDAVQRARIILARRGGVLIADSVGLGKTHIALALMEPFLGGGGRVAVVGPSALERHWRIAARGMPPFDWISHARLSRGSFDPVARDIVVIDEAHALRNPATRRYRAARGLCRASRVVLLTATPVNNGIRDLYHLLRLFSSDRDYLDVGVASLRSAFEEAEAAALLGTAPSIQPVLRSVMIRRTRPLLRELSGAGDDSLSFPAHRPPVPVRYSLATNGAADPLLSIGPILSRLSFPAHRPDAYREDARAARTRPHAATSLIRVGLLKRLESSAQAFQHSLDAYRSLLERCLDGLERGILITPGAEGRADGTDLQLGFDALLFEPLWRGMDVAAYRSDLERELACVGGMTAALGPALESDGKLSALVALLEGPLRGRKVLLFTQFRHTARHLHASLRRKWRVGLVEGSGAWLGADPAHRADVVRRFAPRSNGTPLPAPHEAIDLLIATDVLSEGFNLQDADVVISYDLPWNPVRLVQRIGRIDRLGSPHASIVGYHFLPGELERYLRLLDRLAVKASAIDASVGSDMPALHAELARALGKRDPAVVERIERADAEWFELDERLIGALGRAPARSWAPSAGGLPVGLLPSSGRRAPSGLVAAEVLGRFEWVAIVEGRPVSDDRVCARLIEDTLRAPPEVGQDVAGATGCGEPPGGLPEAELRQLLDAARTAFARRAAVVSTAALLPAGGETARLGRLVLSAAAALPGGPDRGTCLRIERCLERLASLPPELEALLPHIVTADRDPARRLAAVLDRIESLPAASRKDVEALRVGGSGEGRIRLLAALLEDPRNR